MHEKFKQNLSPFSAYVNYKASNTKWSLNHLNDQSHGAPKPKQNKTKQKCKYPIN